MCVQVYIIVSVACGESYEKQENEDKEKEEEDFGLVREISTRLQWRWPRGGESGR